MSKAGSSRTAGPVGSTVDSDVTQAGSPSSVISTRSPATDLTARRAGPRPIPAQCAKSAAPAGPNAATYRRASSPIGSAGRCAGTAPSQSSTSA